VKRIGELVFLRSVLQLLVIANVPVLLVLFHPDDGGDTSVLNKSHAASHPFQKKALAGSRPQLQVEGKGT
jgi:hypothetical protein